MDQNPDDLMQEEVNIVREEVAGTTAILGPLLEGVLEERLEGEGTVGVRGRNDHSMLIQFRSNMNITLIAQRN